MYVAMEQKIFQKKGDKLVVFGVAVFSGADDTLRVSRVPRAPAAKLVGAVFQRLKF